MMKQPNQGDVRDASIDVPNNQGKQAGWLAGLVDMSYAVVVHKYCCIASSSYVNTTVVCMDAWG